MGVELAPDWFAESNWLTEPDWFAFEFPDPDQAFTQEIETPASVALVPDARVTAVVQRADPIQAPRPQPQQPRKKHNPWTVEETLALIDGVASCGSRWADIKKMNMKAIERRSAVDLKDKWRNLLRIAALPARVNRGGEGKIERRRIARLNATRERG